MPHNILRRTQLGILFLCFISAVSVKVAAGIVGVNYGMLANNLPAAVQVAQLLLTTPLRNVKLYNADQATLQAFANTGITVAVGVTNNEISLLAGSLTSAQSWVQTNVAAYMPATKFSHIVVGNEVLTVSPELEAFLVPAMINLHKALVNLQLDGELKVSTPHNLNLIGNSYPPSLGTFNNNVSMTMQAVLAFLSQTNSPFMVNAYPYFAYSANPSSIPLNYAIFQQPNAGITDINTGLHYTNLLDAQLDAVFSAMERLGYNNVPIVISETGWPSVGDPNEIGCGMTNAQLYNGNLIKHITSHAGTPLRPGASTDAFLFALFNEDLKPGPISERNFGLFNPNETVVYNLGLVQTTQAATGPSPASSTSTTSPPPPIVSSFPPSPVYFYPPPAPSLPIYPPPAATVFPSPPPPVTAPPATPEYFYPPPPVVLYPPPPAAVSPTPSPAAPNSPGAYGSSPPPSPAAPYQTQPVGKTWCVAKPGASLPDVTNALNYACGEGGADCIPIQVGNPCYEPDTLTSHASYAFNSYYQLNGRNYWNCYFGNTGLITITDPSYAGCPFP
ncbi:hypothetical protein CY35_03G096500 [Sphagnum magellanicum]|nr:hypothetical protein CY35_03G096500 [Sphagnum magellanicum]